MKNHYETARNNVRVDLRDVHSKLNNAVRTARLYESSILPRSKNALRVVESGYLAGKNGFLDLLDIEKRVLMEELHYFKSLEKYARALVDLERIVGLDLRTSSILVLVI